MQSSERHKQPVPLREGDLFRSKVPRAVLFAFLWWILTEGDPASWAVGVPVVIAATILSMTLFSSSQGRWRFSRLAWFVPFFLWQSLRGGIDVARRALHPHLPLAPLLLDYPLRLPEGPAQVFLADLVSLLPGTLSAELQQGCLTVHAIDGDPTTLSQELRLLENLAADLFRVNLSIPRL